MSRKIIFLYHIESINIGLQAYSGITARIHVQKRQTYRETDLKLIRRGHLPIKKNRNYLK